MNQKEPRKMSEGVEIYGEKRIVVFFSGKRWDVVTGLSIKIFMASFDCMDRRSPLVRDNCPTGTLST